MAFDELARVVQVMPPEKKSIFEHLANVEIRPSFIDIMKLIDTSEERGLFAPDEASSLRAGRVGGIDNRLPNDGGTGNDVRA